MSDHSYNAYQNPYYSGFDYTQVYNSYPPFSGMFFNPNTGYIPEDSQPQQQNNYTNNRNNGKQQ